MELGFYKVMELKFYNAECRINGYINYQNI